MKNYTVKQLAQLAGVSVRTLHLYDQLGLLSPEVRTEARYRLYGEKELLRLQQILFYKELDFPLKEIKEILDYPEFDLIKALESHREALLLRRERMYALLATIDKTISNLKEGTMLTHEELYEGLPKETAEAWHNEAREKWGEAVDRSEEHLRKKSKEEYKALGKAFAENWKQLFLLSQQNENPLGEKTQNEIAKHYGFIREFWGTSGLADKQAEAYTGLGELYVSDERYTTVEGEAHPEFAAFMSKAMKRFAEEKLK